MLDVAAAITNIGVLLWVAMGAVASASGVRPKPASATTLSLTTSSCASRRVVSATPASSFTSTSTFLPPALAPFCASHSLMAASICRPVLAEGPVIGRMTPILTVSLCAIAPPAASAAAASRARWCLRVLIRVSFGRSMRARRHCGGRTGRGARAARF